MTNIGELVRAKEINPRWGNGFYIWGACEDCGEPHWVPVRRGIPRYKICKRCSNRRKTRRGSSSNLWKGGIKHSHGRILVALEPTDFFFPMTKKYRSHVLEHRLVMARHLGRCLHDWEVVHHKNGVKDDNRIENLTLTTRGGHISDHSKGYQDGFTKGFLDGRSKKIQQLQQEIERLKEVRSGNPDGRLHSTAI